MLTETLAFYVLDVGDAFRAGSSKTSFTGGLKTHCTSKCIFHLPF